MQSRPAILFLAALTLLTASCTKLRPALPDVQTGWHSPNFDVVFGRLERIVPKDPTEAPTWIIRYGLSTDDSYRGELAILPRDDLSRYNSGDPVEIRGAVDPTFKSPNYPGTWYNATTLQYWKNSETR